MARGTQEGESNWTIPQFLPEDIEAKATEEEQGDGRDFRGVGGGRGGVLELSIGGGECMY